MKPLTHLMNLSIIVGTVLAEETKSTGKQPTRCAPPACSVPS